jgi:hypothetical protein
MASQGAGDVVVKGPDGTYVGQVHAGTETQHGRGVLTFTSGSRDRYEGEWRDGKQHGCGIMTWTDGDRYEGEWRDGKRHGRGVFWFADGRVFDGAWAGGYPLRGTAMAANHALSLAVFDGRTCIVYGGWDKAVRVAAGRVLEGRPGWGGGGVWRGTVKDAGGVQYTGELRGLRPCGEGILTEAGARFRVAHADNATTLAEGDAPGRMPAPAHKEVRAPPLPPPPRAPGRWLLAGLIRFATACSWFCQDRFPAVAKALQRPAGCRIVFQIRSAVATADKFSLTPPPHPSSLSAPRRREGRGR